jgi:hypothetical protein
MAAQPSPLTIRDKFMKIFLPRQTKIGALGADGKGTISIDERILCSFFAGINRPRRRCRGRTRTFNALGYSHLASRDLLGLVSVVGLDYGPSSGLRRGTIKKLRMPHKPHRGVLQKFILKILWNWRNAGAPGKLR